MHCVLCTEFQLSAKQECITLLKIFSVMGIIAAEFIMYVFYPLSCNFIVRELATKLKFCNEVNRPKFQISFERGGWST